MSKTSISTDQFGRTIVRPVAPVSGSRQGIISRNGDGYYFVPTVNHGETVCHGGRSFATLKGAIKAATRFVTA